MPKRERKKYSKPRKIYDIALIKEENMLIKKYGLKNRREVWKASFAIERIRNIAKSLITASDEEKKAFIERQVKMGFNVLSIADVLALNKEDYLKRRLESIVVKKGIAKTHKQARQFITHKHIKTGENIISSPSHITSLDEEENITLNLELPKKEIINEEERDILNEIKKGEKND